MNFLDSWARLPGPMDLIEIIFQDLTKGKIVILGLPSGVSSWISVEIAEAAKRNGLGQWSSVRSSEADQLTPAQSVKRRSQSENLGSLILWVDATDKETSAKAWGDYVLRFAGSPEIPKICIAMETTLAESYRVDIGLRRRFWTDFVTSTDSRVIAERHVRRFEHSEAHGVLKCTLVSQIAGADLVLAMELARKPLEDILSPEKYPHKSIWGAQISVLFPIIEYNRLRLLRNYRSLWKIPHFRCDGSEVRCLEKLEIGDMAAQAQSIGALKNERKRLGWLRRVRNDLAHLKIVSWATLNSPIGREIVDFG